MKAKNFLAPCQIAMGIFVLLAATFVAAQEQTDEAGSIEPASVTSTTIPSTLFGMSAHDGVLFGNPWPTMTITGMRLWDSGVAWGQINTAKGVYNWTTLDSWVSTAKTHNSTLVFTFGWTPGWASSKSNDGSCDMADGACDPPNDLNSDGTGTDQHFIDFVTAIAKHEPTITYWELWNTPHDIKQWTGTYAQLVRMAQDANQTIKKYIPSAKIISPANGQLGYTYPGANCTMADRLGSFLAAGGTKWIDIVGLHTYYDTVPEHIAGVVQCYQSTMSTYKISSLPIWSTEGAWGLDTSLTGGTNQAGYLARSYLLLWSSGVVRHYWYDWNDPRTGTLESGGKANTAGTAYSKVESWMSGRTMNTLCSEGTSTGIWTCGFSGSGGFAGQAVWHPGSNKTYTPASKYINYLDLSGVKHTIAKGGSVTVGVEPIFLQNQ